MPILHDGKVSNIDMKDGGAGPMTEKPKAGDLKWALGLGEACTSDELRDAYDVLANAYRESQARIKELEIENQRLKNSLMGGVE